jgi:hypothetical protein
VVPAGVSDSLGCFKLAVVAAPCKHTRWAGC